MHVDPNRMAADLIPARGDAIDAMPKLDLEHFKAALLRNPEAAEALGPMSYRRYLGGDFPGAIRWLMRYPEVGAALMRDAAGIAPETLDELDREAEARSKKAQAARDRRQRRK
jgi:hypothetical protein